MGLSVTIDGKPATIESPEIDSYVGSSGLFRCWNVSPFTVVQIGNTNTDSPTPNIYSIHQNPASFLWDKSGPLPIPGGGCVYLVPEQSVIDSRAVDFQNWTAHGTLRVCFDGQFEIPNLFDTNRQFWGGFAKAAVKWAAVTAGAVYAVGMAPGTIGSVGTVASTGASDWAIATAGMGEGMGTTVATVAAPVTVAATTAGTVTTSATVSTAGKAFSEIVSNVKSVAAAAVATRTAIDTIKAADSAPQNPQTTNTTGTNNNMMYAGLAVLVILAVRS